VYIVNCHVIYYCCIGKIYVAGGYDRGVHSDRASVECYDPDTDTWSFITELEKARSGLVLISHNHQLYAFGGRNRSTDHYFDLAEKYNPQTNKWTPVAPLLTPRAWPAATVFDGKIFVLGGFDGANRLASAEAYDPEANSWTYVRDMNVSRAGCGAAAL
jgi:kelch-like protein 2/3